MSNISTKPTYWTVSGAFQPYFMAQFINTLQNIPLFELEMQNIPHFELHMQSIALFELETFSAQGPLTGLFLELSTIPHEVPK